MKGKTHAAIGAATGLGAAVYFQSDPLTAAALVGISSFAALAPDLDIDGKLANKLTISKKWLHLFFFAIGLCLIGYSLFRLPGYERYAGIIVGVSLTIFPRMLIKQRTMLFLTGAAVAWAGYETQALWVLLLSIFVMLASILPHRSLTHSLLGLAYFGFILYHFERAIPFHGSFAAGLCGYLSHLVADMKVWPANRRGIKWFQPFSRKEF